MKKISSIVFEYSILPRSKPKVSWTIFRDALDRRIAEPFLLGEVSERLTIIPGHSAPGAKPEVSRFVLQDAQYAVANQTLLFCKVNKAFAVVFTYPVFCCGKPKIALRILHNTEDKGTPKTMSLCEMSESFTIIFGHSSRGSHPEPDVTIAIFENASYEITS